MLNNKQLMSFAALAALFVLPGVSKANGSEGDELLQVSFAIEHPADEASVSCREAKQVEWFLRQMDITDGAPTNADYAVSCQRDEILAATAEQAD